MHISMCILLVSICNLTFCQHVKSKSISTQSVSNMSYITTIHTGTQAHIRENIWTFYFSYEVYHYGHRFSISKHETLMKIFPFCKTSTLSNFLFDATLIILWRDGNQIINWFLLLIKEVLLYIGTMG